MAKEIERKYLVTNVRYKEMAFRASRIIQGYISNSATATVRVRIRDGQAFLTIKSRNKGIVRDEWEYAIPVSEAESMLKICEGNIIEKIRYEVNYKGHIWEVDEFKGIHQGLIIAEIEMETENTEYSLPPFVGEDVSEDCRYYNSVLAGIE